MERGTVLAYNPKTAKVVVSVDSDSYAVFELVGQPEMQEGHRLRGRLESDVCFALENLTTGEMLEVLPLGTHLDREEAERVIQS